VKSLRLSLVFLVTFFAVLNWEYVEAATYYISLSGNDSNPGTLDSPWKTINKANSTLVAGDTVHLRAGTYSQQIAPANNGSSDNYITYARYEDEQVNITGFSGVQANLANKSYIKINGLRFLNATSSWILFESTTYSIVQNCYLEGADHWAGINMWSHSNYNQILNNTLIATCNGTDGGPQDLVWMVDSSYNLLEGNDFQNGPHNGVDIQRGTGHIVRNNTFSNRWHTSLSFYNGGSRNLIENNVIVDSGKDRLDNWCTDIPIDRTKDRVHHKGLQYGNDYGIIRNNVFINNGCLALDSKSGRESASNNRIYNNTFYKNEQGIQSSFSNPSGNVIKNNIFYQQLDREIVFFCLDPGSVKNYYTHNNFMGTFLHYKS